MKRGDLATELRDFFVLARDIGLEGFDLLLRGGEFFLKAFVFGNELFHVPAGGFFLQSLHFSLEAEGFGGGGVTLLHGHIAGFHGVITLFDEFIAFGIELGFFLGHCGKALAGGFELRGGIGGGFFGRSELAGVLGHLRFHGGFLLLQGIELVGGGTTCLDLVLHAEDGLFESNGLFRKRGVFAAHAGHLASGPVMPFAPFIEVNFEVLFIGFELEHLAAHLAFPSAQQSIQAGDLARVLHRAALRCLRHDGLNIGLGVGLRLGGDAGFFEFHRGLRGGRVFGYTSFQPDDGGGDRALPIHPRLDLVGGIIFLDGFIERGRLFVFGERLIDFAALFEATGFVVDDKAVEVEV